MKWKNMMLMASRVRRPVRAGSAGLRTVAAGRVWGSSMRAEAIAYSLIVNWMRRIAPGYKVRREFA